MVSATNDFADQFTSFVSTRITLQSTGKHIAHRIISLIIALGFLLAAPSLTSMKTVSFWLLAPLENVYAAHYEASKTTKYHLGPTSKTLNHTS